MFFGIFSVFGLVQVREVLDELEGRFLCMVSWNFFVNMSYIFMCIHFTLEKHQDGGPCIAHE